MEKELLITRNVDCATLSKELFVSMMTQDIRAAKVAYDNNHYEKDLQYFNESIQNSIDYYIKKAKEFAEKKWKTERKRNEYINKETYKIINEHKDRKFYYYGVTFFDFDLEPNTNSLSGDCCIDIEKDIQTQLERCYEKIKDNRYWTRGLGWKLYADSRPQIELILSEEVQKEFDAEADALAEDIRRFYANCYYCGD